jgi:hypothetical protein
VVSKVENAIPKLPILDSKFSLLDLILAHLELDFALLVSDMAAFEPIFALLKENIGIFKI